MSPLSPKYQHFNDKKKTRLVQNSLNKWSVANLKHKLSRTITDVMDKHTISSNNGGNARLKLRRQPTAKKRHYVTSGDSRGRRLTT